MSLEPLHADRIAEIALSDMAINARNVKTSNEIDPKHVAHAEDTPAYQALQTYGLLDTKYRRAEFEGIFDTLDLTPNSSQQKNFMKRLRWGILYVSNFR